MSEENKDENLSALWLGHFHLETEDRLVSKRHQNN